MKQHPTVQDWLTLDNDSRRQLVHILMINKSGPTETLNGVLTSDGVGHQDLEKGLSIGAMIAYLGTSLPWYRDDLCDYLFSLVQDKFYGRSIGESRNVELTGSGKAVGEEIVESTLDSVDGEPVNGGVDPFDPGLEPSGDGTVVSTIQGGVVIEQTSGGGEEAKPRGRGRPRKASASVS